MKTISMLARLAVLVALALPLAACGSHQVAGTPSDQAKAQFQKGMEQYEDDNFLEAINSFNVVRTRHPYSNYATLAELKIADSHFELGKYIEAAAAYRSFVRFHPHHPQRAYAMYRVGECYYKQIPGDWWIMPPAYERELSSTMDALRELETFVASFPGDPLVAEADKRIGDLRHRLGQHELYVARFYWKQKKPRGTVMRLDYLLSHYPRPGLSEDALMLKARAHEELGEVELAQQSLARLIREYPASKQARQAREQLASLLQQHAPAAPPAAPPAAAAPDEPVPPSVPSVPATSQQQPAPEATD